jgi:hypothetical protein
LRLPGRGDPGRRTEIARDAADHGDGEVHLSDGRLQPVDDIARCLELVQAADGRGKIEFDPRQELSELVVQLAGDPGALRLAHLFDALGQRSKMSLRDGHELAVEPLTRLARLPRRRRRVSVCLTQYPGIAGSGRTPRPA